MKEEYYSNCLIEALKAKIKWGKQVKIIYIPSWKNEVFCPHFMWHDLADNNIKDFHAECGYVEKWYNLFWFKGHIRCRPYSVYERWLKTREWIICSSQDDMIDTMMELAQTGIETDFVYGDKDKYKLVVTDIEEGEEQ